MSQEVRVAERPLLSYLNWNICLSCWWMNEEVFDGGCWCSHPWLCNYEFHNRSHIFQSFQAMKVLLNVVKCIIVKNYSSLNNKISIDVSFNLLHPKNSLYFAVNSWYLGSSNRRNWRRCQTHPSPALHCLTIPEQNGIFLWILTLNTGEKPFDK